MAEKLKAELDSVRKDIGELKEKLRATEASLGDDASEALDSLDDRLMEIDGNVSSGKYTFPSALEAVDDKIHEGVNEAGELLREARREALGDDMDDRLMELLEKSDKAIEDVVNRLRAAMG